MRTTIEGGDEKISKCRSGVSDKYPTKNYAGGLHGDAEDARRLSAYGKTGNNAKRGVKMTNNDKLEKPREGKPILHNNNQKEGEHFFVCATNGESGIPQEWLN